MSILPDDRWVWLPSLLAERVFTHRVSELEVEHDVLETAPNLAPVASLTSGGPGQQLADGSPVLWLLLPHDAQALVERGAPVDGFGDAVLALPEGTIEQLGVAAGDLVGVRVTGEGLVLDAVGAEPGNRMLDEFARRLGRVLEHADGQPVEIDQAIWECCADDPGLFTQPAPPLGEVLQACGFATYIVDRKIGAGGDTCAERVIRQRRVSMIGVAYPTSTVGAEWTPTWTLF